MLRRWVATPLAQHYEASASKSLHPVIKAMNPVCRPPAVAWEKNHDIFPRSKNCRSLNPLNRYELHANGTEVCEAGPLNVAVDAPAPRYRENSGWYEKECLAEKNAHTYVRENFCKNKNMPPPRGAV